MKRKEIFRLPATAVKQPLGEFYVTSMPSDEVAAIAFADVRRLAKSTTAIEEYLGIQRKLDQKRRSEIAAFVNTSDATFPTSVVIAVEDERCVEFLPDKNELIFFEVFADDDGPAVKKGEIGRILDGQHRLAGLQAAGRTFDLPVTVFPALDIADQAYIFATVNIAQTKVNSSLAYDLLAYSRSRSPERTCHDVVVTLNSSEGSPFCRRIKRLGSATPGIVGETLTQATFVKALLPYITRNALKDREDLRHGFAIPVIKLGNDVKQTPLRNYFIEERDKELVDIVWEYFDSVRAHWPIAWASEERGQIIRRTNGFRSFMNVFGDAFFALGGSDRRYPKKQEYEKIWSWSNITDDQFNSKMYLPGSSGERALTDALRSSVNVFRTRGYERTKAVN